MNKNKSIEISRKDIYQGENGQWEEKEKSQQKAPKIKPNINGFSQYNFFPELFLNLMINKLKNPTPVQKKTIPLIVQGKDVVVCYKTGSGKTLSYILPIINKLQSHSQIIGARALILIPTRDLAQQITKVLKMFLHKIDLRYTLILGGHTFEGQFESLSINPDIIIATPGRLMQLLQETDLKLSRVQTIVFDQADQLFGQNKFQKELKEIMSKCQASQRIMCSATITPDLNDFALVGLRDYSYVHQEITLPEQMLIDFLIVRSEQKPAILLYLLENIIKKDKVIVFVSTRFHVDYLVSLLGANYNCFGVYGKMDMEQRTYALDQFRKRKSCILIVTDVAARGLDIPDVNYVVHFDYPSNHQIFVHRSGRTARVDNKGHTIGLITYHQIAYLIELATFVTKKLSNEANSTDCINFGTVPHELLMQYVNIVSGLKLKNPETTNLEQLSVKGYMKFKTCRTEANQNSLKKAKSLKVEPHYHFANNLEKEQQDFIKKIRDFAPKKSFIELQKISMDIEPQNDAFLTAIQKIRKQQQRKINDRQKKQELRQKNASKWKEYLDKNEIEQFERYRQQKNNQRAPINVEGVNIQIESKPRKSAKRDFRNLNQFISGEKNPGIRTQFDDLPRIKNNQIDNMIVDENHVKRSVAKRVWDKTKKNFVWQKDKEDKLNKQEHGKKAYLKWKKSTKLIIPKAGEMEDNDQTARAQQNWKSRRMARHGWKQTKPKGDRRARGDLKNNKTKAIEKKYKKRLITKSQNSKGGKGDKFSKGGKGSFNKKR